MKILYDNKTDLLYIRLDDKKQEVVNKRIAKEVVLDIGADDKIVGIEFLDASRHITLEKLFPIRYEVSKK